MSMQPTPMLSIIDPDTALLPESLRRAGNKHLKAALLIAISAIYHLDDAGSVALDVDVRGGKPVLQVDRPPQFVQGVASMTVVTGGYRQRRMATTFHGAQIEWHEREAIAPRAQSVPPCVGEKFRDITHDIYRTALED